MDVLMQLNSFILIFVRTTAMIFFMPFLGARNVPRGFKIGLALFTSLILISMVKIDAAIISADLLTLAAGIFLSINAHHLFIAAIAESFALVPPMRLALTQQMMEGIVTLSRDMFILALRIAAPVIVALFITNIALAIVSKTMPQMNVMG